MNEHFQPKRLFSYLFIVAIAVLFGLQWGPGSRGCGTDLGQQMTPEVALVNARAIPVRDFQRLYAGQLNYYRQQGSPISEDLARKLGFHERVLDQLIDEELSAQLAEQAAISVPDSELRDLIAKDPSFQKNGAFDLGTYRIVLRDYLQRTESEYENELRRRMAASKLMSLVESTAAVSDDEVEARYYKEANKANVSFVRFLPTMYADKVTPPTPAELAAFTKDKAKEVADYYAGNSILYKQPEKVRVRHILFALPPGASPEQKAAARAKADALRKDLAGGTKDFATAAKESSEDLATQATGGDLGFQPRPAWEIAFSDAAFALKPQEISDPVETSRGIHLIKLEEKKAPETKDLKDVEGEIARTLWNEDRAKTLARAAAEKALADAKAGKKLAELFPPNKDTQGNAMRFQTESKPETIESGELVAGTDSLPQIGSAPELMRRIFATKAPTLFEELVPTGNGFAVLAVSERKLPSAQEFEQQKVAMKHEASAAKQYELRDAFLKSAKKQAKVIKNEARIATLTGEG